MADDGATAERRSGREQRGFRVLPHWPRGRYLKLALRYWRITRARLDRNELDREIGWLRLPELPLLTMMPSDKLAAPSSPAPWARTAYHRRGQGRGSRTGYE